MLVFSAVPAAICAALFLSSSMATSLSEQPAQDNIILLATPSTPQQHTQVIIKEQANILCPDLNIAAFPKTGYKPFVHKVGEGTNGCVYQFGPGWPGTSGSTVGKTKPSGNEYPTGLTSEVANLNNVHELYAYEKDAMNRWWIVMKKQPGTRLTDTPQYQSALHDSKVCRSVMTAAYHAVFVDALHYITQFGCIHAKKTEMNNENVLFEFADNGHATAHLIDWAGSDCSPSNEPLNVAVPQARELCADYAYNNQPPEHCDLTNKETEKLCRSFSA